MGDINQLETWGNQDTMNMNPIIYQNILDSRYFQGLYEKTTYHDVVNEVYNQVTNVAPFVTGTTPSTAFCCLYKLWTMRLTVKQLEHMIDHKDSPYIRAVGFLYLRYVCAPAQLWDWLGYYLDEEQEINVASGTKPQMKQKFYGTMLPRIPVPIARELEKKLADYDREKTKDKKGTDDHHRSNRRSPPPPSRSRRYSPSPRRRRRSPSRSPSRRNRSSSHHRHDHRSSSRRRDERNDLDDYERRSRRHHSRHDSKSSRRDERDELDDYERRQRHRRHGSRSRDSRRSRYSDDSSDDDDRRRRRQRRSPSVTRERSSEYNRS
ncbi:hypothetical protein [Absidia glauca]|uniref:Pre-mRNA-splicing factor 38 n=1 Tax=Absidia glauca TaxID=4829 RepID=A0A168KNZ3_ABSGL|nr:hypothetical protein [Absidia glauca]